MATEQQIKLARDKFKEISGITIYTPDEGTLDDFEQSRYDGLVAALEAALSAAEPSVAVKDLEWNLNDSWNVSKTVIGTYVVRPCLATKFAGQWLLRRAQNEDSEKTLYASEEEAKAAAQADYEARIRSALIAQVQDVVCETCNGTGKEARHQICRDCDDGWQLAPMEPSDDMIAAAKATTSAALTRSHAAEIYRAMLAAAPAKQEGQP